MAAYSPGIALGLMEHPAPGEPFFGRTKHVFWTDNPVGNTLFRVLDELSAVGVLEKREEPDIQYRWNPAFVGTWEREHL